MSSSISKAILAPSQAPPESGLDDDRGRQIVRKVGRRLMWYLAGLYLISVLDRGNLGFAALTMNRDLHLSAEMYSVGLGVLFLGYAIFEVPSNLILARFGARVTLTRIALFFGVVTMSMAFVTGPMGFYSMRGLLGAAEAGLTPGVFLYLSFWIPSAYRARYNASFSYAIPIAYVCASLISGSILQLDGTFGIPGWKWLFMLEGIPAVAMGIFGIFYLTNRPSEARWLSESERKWLDDQISRERQVEVHHGLGTMRELLRDPIMLWLCFAYIGVFCGNACLAPWLPQIMRSHGVPVGQIGLVAAIPPLSGVIGMILLCRRSDRRAERLYHCLACMLLAAGGFATVALSESAAMAVFGFMLANVGVYSSLAIFWAIPQTFLPVATKPAAIAVISSVGALVGGWLTPLAIGKVQAATHSLAPGLAVVAVVFLVCAAGLLAAGARLRKLAAAV
ncbi:MAG: MFS transporter [Burkholderiaceae bacterium]|jgi:ACS family tartrate transporter-like MFS transporter